ncbi:MAG: AbrB family transcriptional regulator [Pseudoflavonifractor sp.]|nr:AbrB family transcriptional regulator [Pseudoflavonifractor sp.]
MLIRIFLTLAVGCAGGILAVRAKMPAGALVGAMISVAVFNLVTGVAYLPWFVRPCAQAVAGAFIALPLTRDRLKDMKQVVKPTAIIVTGMLAFSILCGYLCHGISGGKVSLMSSFLMSTPGGMSDIVLMTPELGGDSFQVSAVHVIRNFVILSGFPLLDTLLIRFLIRRWPEQFAHRLPEGGGPEYRMRNSDGRWNLFLSLAVALGGGWLGYWTGIPAGALTFSMVCFAAFNITTHRGRIPLPVRRFTQMGTGALVGSFITRDSLSGAENLLGPLLVVLGVALAANLLFGFLLCAVTDMDVYTCFISCIPGGATDMAMIADSLDGDGVKVASIQIIRFICVIALYPQIYLILIRL